VRKGACGVADLTLYAPVGQCEHAAEIGEEYDWKSFCFSKQTYADRCTSLAVGAARLALEDAGVGLPIPEDGQETGIIFGTRWGCLETNQTFFEPLAEGRGKRASSLVFSHSYPNCPTSFIAIEMGLRGYSTSFSGSDAGEWALRGAVDALMSGAAGRILVGASDALARAAVSHLKAEDELPDTEGRTPTEAEAEMWGRVPGEAAVFLLLEKSETPGKRGQLPLAGNDPEGLTPDWRDGNAGAAGALLGLARKIIAG
jgi:3-oxoacyl-[acyl-carrier-protein] synthase II